MLPCGNLFIASERLCMGNFACVMTQAVLAILAILARVTRIEILCYFIYLFKLNINFS